MNTLFPGTAGVSPALSAKREKRAVAGETPAVPGKSVFTSLGNTTFKNPAGEIA